MLAGTQIYKRLQAIWALDKNAPGKLHVFSALPASSVKFTDQLRNCEDVILLDGLKGWALLSCDAGRDNWNTVMVSSLHRLLSESVYYTFEALVGIQTVD